MSIDTIESESHPPEAPDVRLALTVFRRFQSLWLKVRLVGLTDTLSERFCHKFIFQGWNALDSHQGAPIRATSKSPRMTRGSMGDRRILRRL